MKKPSKRGGGLSKRGERGTRRTLIMLVCEATLAQKRIAPKQEELAKSKDMP
jgi:hypothetical protein